MSSNQDSSPDDHSVLTFLEPDSEPDSDSASILSSTKSCNESIYNYIKENGRTYHSYCAGSYPYPNDDPELERQDLQYEILKVLFGGRNFFAPLDNPKDILDIGCGTGKWAIEMGCYFPNSRVTGIDLTPCQPVDDLPRNVRFIIDDANQEDWLVRADYIHARMLIGAFEDFREVIRKAYDHLDPGGWFECQEIMNSLFCDDSTMTQDNPFLEWTRTQHQAAMNLGRPVRIANKLRKWLEDAGFVDVHEEIFKLPINPWPKDPQFKMLGRFHEACLLDGIQAFSLAFFTRGMSWSKEEVEVYLVNVRKAISDRNVHAYHKIYVVWGRKPENARANPIPSRS
ncbi:S-adenosyl-L-methionine-dependent methyltransferase [Lineolata rhizophorae]|uniref:S-adenosyl-L-methionine-dependent methyltransferase n=1 Tax=Lineolata rhizophorae TaxID=578093 RepID=A0A6A6P6A6_9PEZI|nr:S-adenosyl-L-methionine-dependent methyltransferase [Lineolata rhizophorae]